MAVRLFVGNMPYGATEADLRAHFSGVGRAVSNRHPGRPRNRPAARVRVRRVPRPRRSPKQPIARFNQQPFMGRSLSVSEARPREAAARRRRIPPVPAAAGSAAPAARRRRFRRSAPGGGGFGGPRPAARPAASAWAPALIVPGPDRNFGPPKKKSALEREALGKQGDAVPRARSRNATPAGWAGSTTTRMTSARRSPTSTIPRRPRRPKTTKSE